MIGARFKYRTEPVLSPSLSDFWCWRQLANCQRVIVQEIECMICNVTLQPLCKFVIAKLFSIVFNLRVSAFICRWQGVMRWLHCSILFVVITKKGKLIWC